MEAATRPLHPGSAARTSPPRSALSPAIPSGILKALAHKVVDFAIQLAVILFAISFHESAHAWSALKFGDTTARDLGRISLNPIRHIDPPGSILVPIMLHIFSCLICGAATPPPAHLLPPNSPRMANRAAFAP